MEYRRKNPGSPVRTRELSIVMSGDILSDAFRIAMNNDVELGGHHDVRSNCISFWTHDWTTEAKKNESTCIGTIYFWRGSTGNPNAIVDRIDAYEGFRVDDVLYKWHDLIMLVRAER